MTSSPELLADLALTHGMSTFILPVSSVARRRALRRAGGPRHPRARGRRARATRHDGAAARRARPRGDVRVASRLPRSTEARRVAGHTRAPGAHLVEVHDGLRAELARLRDIVEQVVAGEEQAHRARNAINELTMRQNNWTLGAYCQQYCRFVTGHHGLEDRSVFPHLRRSDPELAPVLDRLEQEHLVIHDVLEQLDDALVGLVSGSSGTAELQRVVDRLARRCSSTSRPRRTPSSRRSTGTASPDARSGWVNAR